MTSKNNEVRRRLIPLICVYLGSNATSMAASNFELTGKTEWRTETWSSVSSNSLHQQWISSLEHTSPSIDEELAFLPPSQTNLGMASVDRETRSDIAIQLNYRLPYIEKLRTRLTAAPSQTIYHIGQQRFVNIILGGNIAYGTAENGWSFTASYLQHNEIEHAETIFESRAARFVFTRQLDNKSNDAPPKRFGAEANALYTKTFDSNVTNAVDSNLGLYLTQNLARIADLTLGYRFNMTRNLKNTMVLNDYFVNVTNPVTGLTEVLPRGSVILFDSRDYEYNMHQLIGEISQDLTTSLSASANTTFAFTQHVNVDSSAKVRQMDDKRQNISLFVGGRVDYRLAEQFWWYANASYLINLSSMDTGLTKDDAAEDRQQDSNRAITTIQSGLLGDFRRVIFSTGFFLYI